MSKEFEEVKPLKPGDRVLRMRVRRVRMRRVLTVPALYSAGYGNVGSSIYYALGIVALVALGATPIALGIAGIFFIFTALTYAEGAAMFPEAGGSMSFARRAFGDVVGFLSGWALLLSYIVTISISAFTISPYLGYFWSPFKESPVVGTSFSIGIIVFLTILNIIGIKETSLLNIGSALIDLSTQVLLIVLGFIFLFDPSSLWRNMFGEGNFPGIGGLAFGIALAALAYTGVETMSQMAEEVRKPERRVPRAFLLMVATVLVIFSGISIVALSAMTPHALATEWARDPVAGIAHSLPYPLSSFFKPLVAFLAATILLIATNAGLIGISRLSFAMGNHDLLPHFLNKIHPRYGTPYLSILFFSMVSILILLPGYWVPKLFANLGALYTFGSLLSFFFAHLSIIALRIKEPDIKRPFLIKPNIKISGKKIPVFSLLGAVATITIWTIVISSQPFARNIGFAWLFFGLITFLLLRKKP